MVASSRACKRRIRSSDSPYPTVGPKTAARGDKAAAKGDEAAAEDNDAVAPGGAATCGSSGTAGSIPTKSRRFTSSPFDGRTDRTAQERIKPASRGRR